MAWNGQRGKKHTGLALGECGENAEVKEHYSLHSVAPFATMHLPICHLVHACFMVHNHLSLKLASVMLLYSLPG